MQPSSTLNDYIIFKDEIMKRIRLLENKLNSDLTSNITLTSLNFEKIETKINAISQNNKSLLELITKQNVTIERISEHENFRKRTEQTLVTHEIKIKNILQELDRIKLKYDKIINENLLIPGYIGPGGTYKNLGEYILYEINEFQKIKNDTEFVKNKVDNSTKTALNLIKNSLSQFQKYTDDKYKDAQVMVDRKYFHFSEKILELQSELNKYQYKIERQIKPMQNDVQKLISTRNEPSYANEKKFDDLNKKIKNIVEEFDTMKGKNQDLDIENTNYKQNMNYIDSSLKHSKPKINDNANELNNDLKLSSKRISLQKSLSFKNQIINENEQKISSIISNNDELPQLNSDINSPRKSNISNEDNIENSNNEEKPKNNNEKVLSKTSKKELLPDKKNKNNEEKELFSPMGNIPKKKEKEKINKHINHNIEDLKNNLSNNSRKHEKFIKLTIKKNIENEKEKFIDKGTDGYYISPKNKDTSIKKGGVEYYLSPINKKNSNKNNNYNNNNNKNNINVKNSNPKIKIDSLYKHKSLSMSDSLLNFNINRTKKEDYEEREFNSIKPINQNKIIIRDKFEDKKMSTITLDENIDSNNKNNTNKKDKQNKNNINIFNSNSNNNYSIYNNNDNNSINNNIINNLNIFSKSSKYSFIKSNENNGTNELSSSKKKIINLDVNEEQQQIMKKIRDYYNNKKKLMDKKLNENIVNCNIINLNSNAVNNNKNSSAKSPSYTKSKINKKRNDLREIALKINCQLGRTNYKFYNKKDKINNIKNFSSFENKIDIKDNF